MKRGGFAIAVLLMSFAGAWAAEPPVNDAQHALAIARNLCRHVDKPSLKWDAGLDNSGKTWVVSTLHGIKKCKDPFYVVKIPVNGPSPQRCERVPITRSIFCDCPPKGLCGHVSRPPNVPVIPVPNHPLVRKRDA